MAEYEERSLDDLTEEASPHRLEELRSKGKVAQSRELTAAVALIGVMITLYFIASSFVGDYAAFLRQTFEVDLAKPLEVTDWRSFNEILTRSGKVLIFAFIPISIAGFSLSFLAAVAQVGFLFSSESVTPDFERLNPIAGFLRIFSMKTVVEGLKISLKFVVISSVVYFSLKSEFFTLPNLVTLGVKPLMAYMGSITAKVFGVMGVFLLLLAGLDYFIQWRRFQKQAMMTRSEAKQEAKEREGDPQIKARIRSIQRDAARKRMMKAVPKADVVITNPTHFAIAIVYDPDKAAAPRVVAKGADYLAERIKKIARENGIPTVENKPLARTLYKYVKVGQMIPRSLYQAVAEILAYVYKIKGKKMGASAQPEV